MGAAKIILLTIRGMATFLTVGLRAANTITESTTIIEKINNTANFIARLL
jgi:hypothetical protein